MRRLALLVPLLVAVAVTGTAAGSVDRTPRSVVERALEKVHRAADVSSFAKNPDNRVRVIMALDDPPLAAATYARAVRRVRPERQAELLELVLALLRQQPAGGAGEGDRGAARGDPGGGRISRRYQVLVNGFAVSVPYERLPDLLDTDIAHRSTRA